ncbi:MAG: hypothetical protein OXH06_13020 [Gemmatimonadetes bacterium]|nr:hypothetical protein [Gemmatimonadota bacterium]
MHLLFITLYREDLLDEVLSGLVEMEITGATVLDGTPMERILTEDVPIFAGLLPAGSGRSSAIVAPMKDPSLLDPLIRLFRETGVDFTRPGVGRLFLVPVDFCRGPEGGEPP